MKREKQLRKEMAILGATFTTILLLAGAGLLWVVLDRNDFFLPGVKQGRCIANLERIAHAKAELARDRDLTNGAPITTDQILDYVEGGAHSLKCPAGGTYSINPVGRSPQCSVPGHEMK